MLAGIGLAEENSVSPRTEKRAGKIASNVAEARKGAVSMIKRAHFAFNQPVPAQAVSHAILRRSFCIGVSNKERCGRSGFSPFSALWLRITGLRVIEFYAGRASAVDALTRASLHFLWFEQ
ncbi:MAG: hypothetical protein ACU0DI_14920, partial [Paracoccaceae bacterium]